MPKYQWPFMAAEVYWANPVKPPPLPQQPTNSHALCLLCKRSAARVELIRHGTLDDRVTPCPNGGSCVLATCQCKAYSRSGQPQSGCQFWRTP